MIILINELVSRQLNTLTDNSSRTLQNTTQMEINQEKLRFDIGVQQRAFPSSSTNASAQVPLPTCHISPKRSRLCKYRTLTVLHDSMVRNRTPSVQLELLRLAKAISKRSEIRQSVLLFNKAVRLFYVTCDPRCVLSAGFRSATDDFRLQPQLFRYDTFRLSGQPPRRQIQRLRRSKTSGSGQQTLNT